MATVRYRVAMMLLSWAGKLDRRCQFLAMSYSFTFEDYRGIVLHEDRRGCLLWFRESDYDKAFDESEGAL